MEKTKINIAFEKIDTFNRPVFVFLVKTTKDKLRRVYLTDVNNLFSYDTNEKQILEYYKEHEDALQHLTSKDGGSEGEPNGCEFWNTEFILKSSKCRAYDFIHD